MATAVQPNTFVFNAQSTIADLLVCADTLERTGHRPQLRFVRYQDDINAVAVEYDPTDDKKSCFELTQIGRNALDESGEMAAIAGNDEEEPDPAGLRLRQMMHDVRWGGVKSNTPVVFQGEPTTWGHLSQDEKMLCTFDSEGGLVGEYRF